MSSLSLTVTQKRNMKCKRDSLCPLLPRQMPQWLTKKQIKQSLSTASESPTIPSTEQPEEDANMEDDDVLTPPLQMRMIALAIVRPLLKHVQHKTKCWKQKMKQGACYPHRTGNPQVAAPHRTSLSLLSNEDRGLRLVQGELSPRSHGNHLLQHPGNRSVASPNTNNHRPRWQTWPVGMLKGRRLQFAGTLRRRLTILDRCKSAHTP